MKFWITEQLPSHAPNNMWDRHGRLTEGPRKWENPIVHYPGDLFCSDSSLGSPDLQTSDAIPECNLRNNGKIFSYPTQWWSWISLAKGELRRTLSWWARKMRFSLTITIFGASQKWQMWITRPIQELVPRYVQGSIKVYTEGNLTWFKWFLSPVGCELAKLCFLVHKT